MDEDRGRAEAAAQSRGKHLAEAPEEQRTGASRPAERWAWLAFRVCGRNGRLFKGLTSDNKGFKYFYPEFQEP